MAAFERRTLPEQEEPLHLYEDAPELTRRWWQIFWKQRKQTRTTREVVLDREADECAAAVAVVDGVRIQKEIA